MAAPLNVVASGSAEGIRINFNAFLTYGAEGVLVRTGRLTLHDPAGTWSIEAGDVLSDVRGAARGVRFGRALRPWWRPSVALYVHSASLSATDGSAIAYRDDLQLPFNLPIRGEAISERRRSGNPVMQGRFSIDTFYRTQRARDGKLRSQRVVRPLGAGSRPGGARLSRAGQDVGISVG